MPVGCVGAWCEGVMERDGQTGMDKPMSFTL